MVGGTSERGDWRVKMIGKRVRFHHYGLVRIGVVEPHPPSYIYFTVRSVEHQGCVYCNVTVRDIIEVMEA